MESRKKVLFLVDSPLTGGGGGKGLSTKEKKIMFFLICSRWKIKYILSKTTYPNINISVLVYCVLVVG